VNTGIKWTPNLTIKKVGGDITGNSAKHQEQHAKYGARLWPNLKNNINNLSST
jgi:hypothetical protein